VSGVSRPPVVIDYALPAEWSLKLVIYDLAGNAVKTLAGASQQAGMHEATWYGTDSRGRRVRPGIYFCRLECGGRSATGRMTLLD